MHIEVKVFIILQHLKMMDDDLDIYKIKPDYILNIIKTENYIINI